MRRMRSKPTFWPMRGPAEASVREGDASGMMIPAGDEVSTVVMMTTEGEDFNRCYNDYGWRKRRGKRYHEGNG